MNYSTWQKWLWSQLPRGWFNPSGPIINAIINGVATATAQSSSDLQFVQNQTRIATATGEYLDLCSVDYLGFGNLPRRAGEPDASFRSRIQFWVLRELGTRQALIDVLTEITGNVPVVFEPIRDAQYFDSCYLDYNAQMGSYDFPYSFLISIQRPNVALLAHSYAFDNSYLDYNAYFGGDPTSEITDAELMQAVALVCPAGITAVVNIVSGPIPTVPTVNA